MFTRIGKISRKNGSTQPESKLLELLRQRSAVCFSIYYWDSSSSIKVVQDHGKLLLFYFLPLHSGGLSLHAPPMHLIFLFPSKSWLRLHMNLTVFPSKKSSSKRLPLAGTPGSEHTAEFGIENWKSILSLAVKATQDECCSCNNTNIVWKHTCMTK